MVDYNSKEETVQLMDGSDVIDYASVGKKCKINVGFLGWASYVMMWLVLLFSIYGGYSRINLTVRFSSMVDMPFSYMFREIVFALCVFLFAIYLLYSLSLRRSSTTKVYAIFLFCLFALGVFDELNLNYLYLKVHTWAQTWDNYKSMFTPEPYIIMAFEILFGVFLLKSKRANAVFGAAGKDKKDSSNNE